jgi:hypothetical protein
MILKKSIFSFIFLLGMPTRAEYYPAQWALAASGVICIYYALKEPKSDKDPKGWTPSELGTHMESINGLMQKNTQNKQPPLSFKKIKIIHGDAFLYGLFFMGLSGILSLIGSAVSTSK